VPLELVVRDSPAALLDEPFAVRARGGGDEVLWRARYRDDRDRVWRAAGPTPEELTTSWAPSKPGTGPVAALESLRPVSIDVRVEMPDGAAAARTLTRRLLAEGVRPRRWRDGLKATFFLPAERAPVAPLVLDAADQPEIAALAAPLLASRGILVLAVAAGDLAVAAERLAALPAAEGDARTLRAGEDVVLPPNVGSRDPGGAERIAAWDALLADLGARPRADA
jgi:hypothetical protein